MLHRGRDSQGLEATTAPKHQAISILIACPPIVPDLRAHASPYRGGGVDRFLEESR